MGTLVGSLRLWAAYTELRRLTMRGERFRTVRVARSLALASSSWANQRWRRRGRSGGKGPGAGLCAAHQLNVTGEG